MLDEVCAGLRTVFSTANALTLPISGTGSAGMEAAVVNVLGPGDVCVVAVNGLFGQRLAEVAARCGAEVVAVDHEWGTPVDAERVLAAHPAPKVIAVVHAETSTGVRSDLAPIGAGKGDALLLADCVTSLGGIELDVDGWGVDLAYSGTQKCLGVPPGLAPLTVGERARERLVERSQSWYLDLRLLGAYTGAATGRRTYHHTAPVSMVQSLRGGLATLLDEGLDAAWARHAACGALVQDGLESMGLELFARGGPPPAAAHHRPGARRGRRRGGAGRAARPVGDRDRWWRRRLRRSGVAHRLHGPHRSPRERRDPPRRAP